jgi:glycosyltransferase involved in cell wall biosynthesis
MGERPHLSLVVPVFRGSEYLVRNVSEIVGELETLQRPFEILVVSDGCALSTTAAHAIEDPRVRVLGYEHNEGKGYAITYGIAHATGRLVGWLDADLDVAPSVIVAGVRCFDVEEIDAAVGSKRHPESAVHYPWYRRVLSWGYQRLVRLLFRVDVRDTQVGAKVFRREMLATVMPLLLIKRYAFDLEVLAVGAEFGFDRIREAPIELAYRFTGTGISHRAVRLMFQDTLAIAYRIHLRHWYVRQYAALQRQRGDILARDGFEALDAAGPMVPAATLSGIRASLQ